MTNKTTQPREQAAIDLDKLAILMAHYLAGNVPSDLYWRVDVTAEALRRALAVARSAPVAAPEAPTDERRNIAEVKRTSDMGLSLRFLSARSCSAFERYLASTGAALKAPLEDDPDSNAAFVEWRRDNFIGAAEKWIAWGAWRAALTQQSAAQAPSPDIEQLANRVRDLIADHVADNWPMVRHPLEEIEKKLRAINAGHLLKQADASRSAATEQMEKPWAHCPN